MRIAAPVAPSIAAPAAVLPAAPARPEPAGPEPVPTPATRPTSVLGVVEALLAQPWGRELQVQGRPITELADSTAWLELSGTGPFSTRVLKARSTGGQRLLDSPQGAAARQAILGAASIHDAWTDRSIMRGVAFASTPEETALAWAANLIAEYNRVGTRPIDITANPTPEQLADVDGALRMGWKLRDTALAFQNDWTTFGHHLDGAFRGAIADAAAGKEHFTPEELQRNALVTHTLVHEMEHDVTFPGWVETLKPSAQETPLAKLADYSLVRLVSAFEPIRWMEEGAAELLTIWPGMPERIEQVTGLPGLTDGYTGYDTQVDGMRRVLRLGGIDVTSPAARDEAVRVLQDGSLFDAPARLAQLIVTSRGLDPAVLPELTERISSTSPVSPYLSTALPDKLRPPVDRIVAWLSDKRFDRLERYVEGLPRRA